MMAVAAQTPAAADLHGQPPSEAKEAAEATGSAEAPAKESSASDLVPAPQPELQPSAEAAESYCAGDDDTPMKNA